MKQRRSSSLIEAAANTIIGYAIAIACQLLVFPWFGIIIPMHAHLLIGIIFMGISLARSYLLRRLFEFLRITGLLP